MSFRRIFETMKHFYFFEWRGSERPSPAFQGEVIQISRSAWNHITSSPKRSRSEILVRLTLLPLARELIEKSTFIQTYRCEEKYEYWSLQGLFDELPVRVVVRSLNKGPKHLYSVFRPLPNLHSRRHKKEPLSRLAPRSGVGGAEHLSSGAEVNLTHD